MKGIIHEKIGDNKMNIKFIMIGFFLFIIMIFGCSECAMDHEYPIKLENKSNHKIDVLVASYLNGYPDTILPPGRRSITIDIQKGYSQDLGLEHEKLFNKTLATDTMSIFIFHTDTLNKHSWDVIRDRYMVLRRYDLSLDDLKKLDKIVPYPPSPAMSNMKMYPPYKRE